MFMKIKKHSVLEGLIFAKGLFRAVESFSKAEGVDHSRRNFPAKLCGLDA